MFNYLKKLVARNKKTPPEETTVENIGASVTFFMHEGEPMVDISVADYTEESVEDLTTLLIGLTGSLFFVPTLDMVNDGFVSESKHEILLKIITSLGEMEQLRTEKKGKEEPCIKPHDLI